MLCSIQFTWRVRHRMTEKEEKEFLKEVRKMIRENPDLEVALSRL